jgi:transglutaminase-like putative cysteine protease
MLQPHLLRLRPRSDGWQTLTHFEVTLTPTPLAQSDMTDLDGNQLVQVWFKPELTDQLDVQVRSHVMTHQSNPFNYLLEPWAMQLPLDYPASLLAQLTPYLGRQGLFPTAEIDPIAQQLAHSIAAVVADDPIAFLGELNRRIYENCRYLIRETGQPFPPSVTWTDKQGSCRDLTVLFMAACRAMGLGARYVSGYQEGDADNPENTLHAWAEVYLPGAGWRGYDPTHGLAVSDRHIALVASAIASYTAPITGSIKRSGDAQATMTADVTVQRLTPP